MNSNKHTDLKRLARLAFRQAEQARPLIERFYRLKRCIVRHPDFHYWVSLNQWLFAPLTLWPIDILGAAGHVLGYLQHDQRIGAKLELLITLLGPPPDESVQEVVIAQDHLVQQGSYEKLVRQLCKYEANEKELLNNPEFKRDWQWLKDNFNVAGFRNSEGIIRRRTVQERNFRGRDWAFRWSGRNDQFQVVFDAFCHRWNLYGMENEKPLLLKLSVNLTPHGTMIFIPSYWSFDLKRDLNWREIMKLHKARGVQRQGPKLSRNKQAKCAEAEAARMLWKEASAKGLRGAARNSWVVEHMGWPIQTDESKLKRLLRFGRH